MLTSHSYKQSTTIIFIVITVVLGKGSSEWVSILVKCLAYTERVILITPCMRLFIFFTGFGTCWCYHHATQPLLTLGTGIGKSL